MVCYDSMPEIVLPRPRSHLCLWLLQSPLVMHNDIAPHIQVFYLAFQTNNIVQPQLIFDCSIKTNQTLKHFLTKLATCIYCCFYHNSLITLKSFHFESTLLAITGHTTLYGNRIAEQ